MNIDNNPYQVYNASKYSPTLSVHYKSIVFFKIKLEVCNCYKRLFCNSFTLVNIVEETIVVGYIL